MGNEHCRVPKCFLTTSEHNKTLIVLEDLDAAGFPARKRHLTNTEAKVRLKWLANFHAIFIQEKPQYLWDIGSYWHLATRPDEFKKMKKCDLKKYAHAIDKKLNSY